MARKRDLASKLSSEPPARPGWRDTITGGAELPAAEPEPADVETPAPRRRRNKLQRKTYLLTPDLVDRIAGLAEEERVGINELVRWLLREALAQVDDGDLTIPTRPANRQIVQ